MKKLLILLLMCMTLIPASGKESQERWHHNKYSMFIHFGLYSELGGVWEGKPVTRGYSEQIQSFAGIFSDWYGDTALRFNPTLFHADSIVALAKKAGMRSIIFTTKHHDGFCMFKTATTDYNSYDATPGKRDFVKELAEACKRGGINFGMYFSLIDWHFPQAYPISSHTVTLLLRNTMSLRNNRLRNCSPIMAPSPNFGLIWVPILPNKAKSFMNWFTNCNRTAW